MLWAIKSTYVLICLAPAHLTMRPEIFTQEIVQMSIYLGQTLLQSKLGAVRHSQHLSL